MKKFLISAVILITVSACAPGPYEVEINEFYYGSTKGSVRIEGITIDTLVTFEQAKPLLDDKLERIKKRLRDSYDEEYRRLLNDPESTPQLQQRAKEKLDSANAGLFSPSNHQIKSFSAYLTEKPAYEQVTLRYKLSSVGNISEQIFISRITAKDTTLHVSDVTIAEYLKR